MTRCGRPMLRCSNQIIDAEIINEPIKSSIIDPEIIDGNP
jgi:hypothetical protein